jgi:hypothetical protein
MTSLNKASKRSPTMSITRKIWRAQEKKKKKEDKKLMLPPVALGQIVEKRSVS